MNIDLWRKLAGITERVNDDDDEDMSSAERALAQKADTDLRKRGINVEKDLAAAEKKEEAKKKKVAAAKPAAKQEPKEESKEEPKQKGSAKKRPQALAWLKSHPSATRGEFMKAAEGWGMSRAYAGSHYYLLRKRARGSDVKEAWMLFHPSVPRFALAENRQFNRYQWISLEDGKGLEPLCFFNEQEALDVAKYMSEYQSQVAVVERLDADV